MKTSAKKQYDISLGQRIRKARKEARISVEVLAPKLEITRQAYSNKERGQNPITAYELTVIARELAQRVDILADITLSTSAVEVLASIPIVERVEMY